MAFILTYDKTFKSGALKGVKVETRLSFVSLNSLVAFVQSMSNRTFDIQGTKAKADNFRCEHIPDHN